MNILSVNERSGVTYKYEGGPINRTLNAESIWEFTVTLLRLSVFYGSDPVAR